MEDAKPNSSNELASFLSEMFPAIDKEIIKGRLLSFPNESVESSIDYFLLHEIQHKPKETKKEEMRVSDNSNIPSMPQIKSEPDDMGVEMISSQPQQLIVNDKGEKEIIVIKDDDDGDYSEYVVEKTKEEEEEEKVRQDTKRVMQGDKKPAAKRVRTNTVSLEDQLQAIRQTRNQQWKNSRSNTTAGSTGPYQASSSSTRNNSAAYYDQMRSIRDKHRNKWQNTKLGKKRIWTVNDLDEQAKNEESAKADWGDGSGASKPRGGINTFRSVFFDPVLIGKEALDYTNKFREANKLPPLKWHQSLCTIGAVHSKNMGDGKVAFGHDGFNGRVKQYPMHYSSAAENVAMSQGLTNVARVAVDGWIDSPGHRKNLLSRSTWCGIGVYQNSKGAWYLTQLFAG